MSKLRVWLRRGCWCVFILNTLFLTYLIIPEAIKYPYIALPVSAIGIIISISIILNLEDSNPRANINYKRPSKYNGLTCFINFEHCKHRIRETGVFRRHGRLPHTHKCHSKDQGACQANDCKEPSNISHNQPPEDKQ